MVFKDNETANALLNQNFILNQTFYNQSTLILRLILLLSIALIMIKCPFIWRIMSYMIPLDDLCVLLE